MRVAVDLHIHTALSPCADNDMTPNNIVNMAILKGLDVIAVTDHNSVENFLAVSSCAHSRNLLVVAGMEVETREEVHLLCLFPGIQAASKMQDIVYKALPKLNNREDVFGLQVLMDENDNIMGHYGQLLATACRLSLDDVFISVEKLGGVVIPAHADRESYSIISNLGIIPGYLNIKTIEVSRDCDMTRFSDRYPGFKGYSYIRSSDAHRLGDILERESFLELDRLNTGCLMELLKSERK